MSVHKAELAGYDPMVRALEDPYRFFRAAHERCPVHRRVLSEAEKEQVQGNPLLGRPTDHFFTVFGYEDVKRILSDHELFSSAQGPGPERLLPLNDVGMLVYADEPHHRPQRRIVTGAFTPRRVTMIEDRIRELVVELIDGFLADGRVEVVRGFANVIPGTVFAELLGVPAREHAMFKQWADDIVSAFGGSPEAQERSVPVMARLSEYFLAVFAERRRVLADGGTLPDDLITALMTSEFEGRYFDDTELILAIHIFMVAGLETTATAITNAVYLLAVHPDQRDLLLRDVSLIPNAVEEVLRYESPVQQLFRTTTSATEIAGRPIAADDKVSVQYGAANRDPRVFPDPDAFDVTRDPATLRKHLAFGFGIHTCLGAALARAELRIALEELLHRIGAWELDPADQPVRGGSLIVRTFASLPITWTPASEASR